MKKSLGLLLLFCLFFLPACEPVLSINPLYTETDLVTEPLLEGCWIPENKKECALTFEPATGNAYDVLAYPEAGIPPTKFRARLLRLDGQLYLDIILHEDAFEAPDSAKKNEFDTQHLFPFVHIIPGHTFHKVELDGDTMRFAYLRRKWLQDELRANRLTVDHRVLTDFDSIVVLTADTPALQKLVLRAASDEKAFSFTSPLRRRK